MDLSEDEDFMSQRRGEGEKADIGGTQSVWGPGQVLMGVEVSEGAEGERGPEMPMNSGLSRALNI